VLREFGVPTPARLSAFFVEEAPRRQPISRAPWSSSRRRSTPVACGKAGGVKVVKSVDDMKKEASACSARRW